MSPAGRDRRPAPPSGRAGSRSASRRRPSTASSGAWSRTSPPPSSATPPRKPAPSSPPRRDSPTRRSRAITPACSTAMPWPAPSTGWEHSIAVGSRGDSRGGRKCLSLKTVPPSRLVIRTQQQDGFRTLLLPVDARPLQPQVHHAANGTLDRSTADRQLRLHNPRVIHPPFPNVPFEIITLSFQRLAGAGATHGVDRRLHLVDLTFQQPSPLATDPRLTLLHRPAPSQGRDLAQVLHRMIKVH